MGDEADQRKLWEHLRAAVRRAGLTTCVCSGYRSQSYGLWQIMPSRATHRYLGGSRKEVDVPPRVAGKAWTDRPRWTGA